MHPPAQAPTHPHTHNTTRTTQPHAPLPARRGPAPPWSGGKTAVPPRSGHLVEDGRVDLAQLCGPLGEGCVLGAAAALPLVPHLQQLVDLRALGREDPGGRGGKATRVGRVWCRCSFACTARGEGHSHTGRWHALCSGCFPHPLQHAVNMAGHAVCGVWRQTSRGPLACPTQTPPPRAPRAHTPGQHLVNVAGDAAIQYEGHQQGLDVGGADVQAAGQEGQRDPRVGLHQLQHNLCARRKERRKVEGNVGGGGVMVVVAVVVLSRPRSGAG